MNDFIAEQIREALKDSDRVNVRIVSEDDELDVAGHHQFKEATVDHRGKKFTPAKRKTLLRSLWPF